MGGADRGGPGRSGRRTACGGLRGVPGVRERDAETLETLRMAHAEPIAPAHYAAVRARVMAELHPRRRWGWLWVAAGVAAVVLLSVGGLDSAGDAGCGASVAGGGRRAAGAGRSRRYGRRRAPVVKRPVVARKAAPEEEIVVKVETGIRT